MKRLFGTDGVRGVANREITPELAFRLGRAAVAVLAADVERPRIVVGRDTRASGEMLQSALVAGFLSAGADCLDAGVIPTPAVAYLTRLRQAQAGAVISASHNPVEDNGIKFFGPNGYKLSDELEARIEELVYDLERRQDHLPRPIGGDVGRLIPDKRAANDYLDFLLSCARFRLNGLRIVIDTAYGAAFRLAPRLFSRLGADVLALHLSPNGTNINVGCGSTHPELAAERVRQVGADVGLTFDGDADRLIAIDEQGNIVDGDHILAICALDRLRRQQLPGKAVVATVYSNLGLRKALLDAGGELLITGAGDRQVMEALLAHNLVLGGEQSGHIVFLEHHTTGDGMLTAIQLLDVMMRTGRRLSDLAAQMPSFPQMLVNVRVRTKENWDKIPAVQEALARARETLGAEGELNVRPSGTEPVIRVMAQGPERAAVEAAVEMVTRALEVSLGV
ncbi:MAG: phosphoglucosamine mutase [Limnochordales bacterium]|nr:phosphoglucosamine mutase [Limnochordales bacterium]